MAGRRTTVKLAGLAAVLLVQGSHGLAGVRAEWTVEGDRAIGRVSASPQLTLSGWFHVIWNGEPRFILIDDRGVATRLVIDEPMMRAFGGPRGLDRKRVTIGGQRVDDVPEVVRVLAIELDARTK